MFGSFAQLLRDKVMKKHQIQVNLVYFSYTKLKNIFFFSFDKPNERIVKLLISEIHSLYFH